MGPSQCVFCDYALYPEPELRCSECGRSNTRLTQIAAHALVRRTSVLLALLIVWPVAVLSLLSTPNALGPMVAWSTTSCGVMAIASFLAWRQTARIDSRPVLALVMAVCAAAMLGPSVVIAIEGPRTRSDAGSLAMAGVFLACVMWSRGMTQLLGDIGRVLQVEQGYIPFKRLKNVQPGAVIRWSWCLLVALCVLSCAPSMPRAVVDLAITAAALVYLVWFVQIVGLALDTWRATRQIAERAESSRA